MAVPTLKHAFTNPKADGGDATITRPSDWNADHVLTGMYPDQIGRWIYDYNGKLSIEATVTGTGAVTAPAGVNTYTTFATGATSGSTAGGRINIGAGGSLAVGVGKARFIKLGIQYGNIDANTNSKVYLTDESATGNPSDTAKHFGLRQAGATIFFSTADGAVEQTTDISAAFSAGATNLIDITFDGTTALCYVNGVLKATHATRVPSPAAPPVVPVIRVYITNTAAAAKTMYIDTFRSVYDF